MVQLYVKKIWWTDGTDVLRRRLRFTGTLCVTFWAVRIKAFYIPFEVSFKCGQADNQVQSIDYCENSPSTNSHLATKSIVSQCLFCFANFYFPVVSDLIWWLNAIYTKSKWFCKSGFPRIINHYSLTGTLQLVHINVKILSQVVLVFYFSMNS